jgi:hypothetical protein
MASTGDWWFDFEVIGESLGLAGTICRYSCAARTNVDRGRAERPSLCVWLEPED